MMISLTGTFSDRWCRNSKAMWPWMTASSHQPRNNKPFSSYLWYYIPDLKVKWEMTSSMIIYECKESYFKLKGNIFLTGSCYYWDTRYSKRRGVIPSRVWAKAAANWKGLTSEDQGWSNFLVLQVSPIIEANWPYLS